MNKNFKDINDFANSHYWQIKKEGLYKAFQFNEFRLAMEFINEIAKISIKNNHHPKLFNSYTNVELFWFTNDENKITEKGKSLV